MEDDPWILSSLPKPFLHLEKTAIQVQAELLFSKSGKTSPHPNFLKYTKKKKRASPQKS